jgi:prepilin peptidase CpaA
MNLFVGTPEWLIAIFCALVVAAGIQDFLRLKISNAFPVAVLLAAAVAIVLRGLSLDVWENVAVFGALLGVGTLLFAGGYMGGGDVKLFAAVGLWTDFERAIVLIPAVLMTGGVLALLLLSRRFVPLPANAAGRSRKDKKVPYGVAIAIGTLIVVAIQVQSRLESNAQLARLSALTSGASH